MARVVIKLVRILNWRVKARAVLTIPVFLTWLIATQAGRKLRKWWANQTIIQELPAESPEWRAIDTADLAGQDQSRQHAAGIEAGMMGTRTS